MLSMMSIVCNNGSKSIRTDIDLPESEVNLILAMTNSTGLSEDLIVSITWSVSSLLLNFLA